MKGLVLAALCAGLISTSALADVARSAGDWVVRGGIGVVDPDSDNLKTSIPDVGSLNIEVDEGYAITLTAAYMVTDHFGVELLASTPFSHDIDLSVDGQDVGKIGETKHLPPTLTAQWYFSPIGNWIPYVGAGLNLTVFFSEDVNGVLKDALGATDLSLDESLGIALQIGSDFHINDNLFVNVDIRWIDINTDATVTFAADSPLNPTPVGLDVEIGEVEIDPFVYSINLGWKF